MYNENVLNPICQIILEHESLRIDKIDELCILDGGNTKTFDSPLPNIAQDF